VHERRKSCSWRDVGFFLIIRALGRSEVILGALVHPKGMGLSIYDLERLTLSRICFWYQRHTEINKQIKDDIDSESKKVK